MLDFDAPSVRFGKMVPHLEVVQQVSCARAMCRVNRQRKHHMSAVELLTPSDDVMGCEKTIDWLPLVHIRI